MTRAQFWRHRWRVHSLAGRAWFVAVAVFSVSLVVVSVLTMLSAGQRWPALAWSLGVPLAVLAVTERAYRQDRGGDSGWN